jgi:hypothetical protein
MNFVHTDLGYRERGDIVEITLTGSAANVRLLDNSNFDRYQRGQQHTYRGGLATKSPIRLSVPSSGRWHVVIDMQGLRGTSRSSVRVISAST